MKTNIIFKGLLWTTISILLSTGCTPISVTDVGIHATMLFPSVTPQPLLTETSTRVPLSTTTLVPLPTLTAGEQENYVRELLKTNAGCQLPCWWGITPGKTSWGDAERFLRYLGANIGQTKLESGIIYYNISVSNNSYGFFEQLGVVDTVSVMGNNGGTQNQRDFESMWESYSPKQVLGRYGVPSRILLSTTGVTGLGDTGNNGYILWIFYDYSGFMIRYDGTVADLPVYHFCPELKVGADDISRIDITLQYPDHPLPLEQHDSILPTQPSRAMSIQDATGMSLKEFHQLFSQDEKPACFDTPHNIWPVR